MKIVRNNIFPFQGYKAVNIFGILFVRKNAKISQVLINHESIHTKQILEMLWIFFYIWYAVEWFIRLFLKGNAYKNIAFEKEAYMYEKDLNYLNNRKHYNWIKLL